MGEIEDIACIENLKKEISRLKEIIEELEGHLFKNIPDTPPTMTLRAFKSQPRPPWPPHWQKLLDDEK